MIRHITIIGDGLFRWSESRGYFLPSGYDKPYTEVFVIFRAVDSCRPVGFYVATDGDEFYEVKPIYEVFIRAFALRYEVPLALAPPLIVNGHKLDSGDISWIHEQLDNFFNSAVLPRAR